MINIKIIQNVSFYTDADIQLQSGISKEHLIGDVTGVENLNDFLSEEVKKQLKPVNYLLQNY
jgi:hypothetical protein